MGLHPVRVALDAQTALLAELEKKFSQFPLKLHELYDLIQKAEALKFKVNSSEVLLMITKSTSGDSNLKLSRRMLDITLKEISLKKRGLSDEVIENFSQMHVAIVEAKLILELLEEMLMDIESELYVARQKRAAKAERVAKIGPGDFVDPTPTASLAKRFTIPRSRWYSY